MVYYIAAEAGELCMLIALLKSKFQKILSKVKLKFV